MLCTFLFGIGLLAVIFKLYIKLTTGWCRSQVNLQGKTVIVTGANTGLGYETAIDLAKRGAKVILACRSEIRAREAQEKIINETHNKNISYKIVDFLSLDSVKQFADEIKKTEDRLDILVNNAGAFNNDSEKTKYGLIPLMQINYFAPVLLTELLLDLIKKSSGRIVNVSSVAGKLIPKDDDLSDLNRFYRNELYRRSKLCNILYTIELASRLEGSGATTYSLHPGVVKTGIFRNVPPLVQAVVMFVITLFFKNPIEGAQTTIHCAVANGIEQYSGEHFHDCQVVSRYPTARDPQLVKKIWNDTKRHLKL